MGKKVESEGPNKSEFIRNELTKNPKITGAEVQEAWAAAGNKGKLNPTLYYQQKSKLGLKRRRRRSKVTGDGEKRPVGRPKMGRPSQGESMDGDSMLRSIESELDSLIQRAAGDSRIVESLRVARRRVSAKLVD